MYRVEIIFRFNQDNTLPDCISNVHRVANTDYFEILTGTFAEHDFGEVHSYLTETHSEKELVSYYFEFIKGERA